MSSAVLFESDIPNLPRMRGKVREVYDLGDRLLLVASDRISAFDWILSTPIPDKGRILTGLSEFWFHRLGVPHHLISMNLDDAPELVDLPAEMKAQLTGRSMICRKAEVAPVECVVRGYLAGSGWKEYRETQSVCGEPLPPGLRQADRLPEPIFTPATKAKDGHDENISFMRMIDIVGRDVARELRDKSVAVYQQGAEYAAERGLILCDTKLEWGRTDEGWILVDEVLTPDSSRYWPADLYMPGTSPPSFDKQYVRDWLEGTDWNKNSPPPELPEAVVKGTTEKYREAYRRLVGQEFRSAAD